MSSSPKSALKSAEGKRVYFVSLGCSKNRVDTEVMLGAAVGGGHEIVANPEDADAIVVNTCSFIGPAKEESVDTILEMAEFKKHGSAKQLIVTGCMPQRYSKELSDEIPEIDALLGSADYPHLGSVLGATSPALDSSVDSGGKARRSLRVVEVSSTPTYLYDHNTPRIITGPTHSVFVKIAEGCDRPCGFCIIPKLRGPQRSRTIESIVAEVRRLVAGGTVEINLIAQDLTRYGVDLASRPTLALLLRELGKVDDLRWIRLHYTYPSAFTDDLIATIAEEEKVVPYVDVPLQHINSEMLKKMRRGHSARVTHELIERLRTRVEGLVLRTTFIVGHPGETEESFSELAQFVSETNFDRVGVFPYSPEPGTSSFDLTETVAPEVALERQSEIMEIQRNVSKKLLKNMVGQTIEVLVDGVSDESDLVLKGRFYGQAPEVDGVTYLENGDAAPGKFTKARVVQSSDYDIVASLDQ